MKQHDTDDRNRDLYSVYLDVLKCPSRPTSYIDILDLVVKSPAKRFYTSCSRAYRVVNSIRRGEKIVLSEERHRMFEEISRRVDIELCNHPSLCLESAVLNVIIQPAPEFYIKASSAKIILHYERKRQKEEFKKNPAIFIRG